MPRDGFACDVPARSRVPPESTAPRHPRPPPGGRASAFPAARKREPSDWMKWLAPVATRYPRMGPHRTRSQPQARRPAMDHVAIDLGGKESQVCVRAPDGTIVEERRLLTRTLPAYLE